MTRIILDLRDFLKRVRYGGADFCGAAFGIERLEFSKDPGDVAGAADGYGEYAAFVVAVAQGILEFAPDGFRAHAIGGD